MVADVAQLPLSAPPKAAFLSYGAHCVSTALTARARSAPHSTLPVSLSLSVLSGPYASTLAQPANGTGTPPRSIDRETLLALFPRRSLSRPHPMAPSRDTPWSTQ